MTLSELIAQLQQAQAEHGDGTLKRADVAFMEARQGGRSHLVTLRYEWEAEREYVSECQPRLCWGGAA